jgi:hypothetical protein
MIIIGNPLIGKTLSYSNLKLSDKALFYTVEHKGEKEFIFLTADHIKICELIEMPLSIAEQRDGSIQEFFEFVCNSRYFKPRRLHGAYIDHLRDVWMIVDFEKYLIEKGIDQVEAARQANGVEFTKIPLEKLIAMFPDVNLLAEIDRNLFWLKNRNEIVHEAHQIFNGKKIIEKYPNIHRPNIEVIFNELSASFESPMERFLWLHKQDFESIASRFVKSEYLIS